MKRPILEQRRQDIQRVQAASAQPTWALGRVMVSGVGETEVEIKFSCLFSDRPLPFFGSELEVGDSTEYEYFPTITAIVTRWITTGSGVHLRYAGAVVAIRTTGPVAFLGRQPQRIYVSYGFNGVALTSVNV